MVTEKTLGQSIAEPFLYLKSYSVSGWLTEQASQYGIVIAIFQALTHIFTYTNTSIYENKLDR